MDLEESYISGLAAKGRILMIFVVVVVAFLFFFVLVCFFVFCLVCLFVLFCCFFWGGLVHSPASLPSVGDKSLVHEPRKLAAAELHVNVAYHTQHPALKSVYGKSQSVTGGKLFSSYIGKSAKTKILSKLFNSYIWEGS